jgi:hypothetical protein
MAFDVLDGQAWLEGSTMTVGEAADLQFETCHAAVLVDTDFAAPAGVFAWIEQAVCRGVGTAEFYGTAMSKGSKRCRVCPVIEPCFWWAIVAESDLGYRCGLWGGATPTIRAQVARVTGVEYARSRFAAAAAQCAPAERA